MPQWYITLTDLLSIECYNPFTKRIEQTALQKALDNWAQYLGVANEVRTEVAGASGVTWKVVLKQGHKPLHFQRSASA